MGPTADAGASSGRLEIGRIVKPHGIRGEVVVAPVTNRPERFESGSIHWRESPGTPAAQLVVAKARRHQGRWIVAYEGVDDRDGAEDLRDVVLTGEPIDVLDDGEMWTHEVIGATVVDAAGVVRGEVVEVEVNPAHDLLVLDTGVLVPVVFVTSFSRGQGSGGVVSVDPPPGLFPDGPGDAEGA